MAKILPYLLWGKSHIDLRTQCFIMTQTRWPLPPTAICVIFQNFDKIDSFLKLVLNIFILGNFIVGWGEGFMKVFCIRSIDLGDVKSWESRMHQSESWYYLGPSQTSKVEFLAEIVFGYNPLTFFVKSSNLDVWLDPYIRGFQKHFLCFVSEVLHLGKKYVISKPVCLSSLFQEKMWLIG